VSSKNRPNPGESLDDWTERVRQEEYMARITSYSSPKHRSRTVQQSIGKAIAVVMWLAVAAFVFTFVASFFQI